MTSRNPEFTVLRDVPQPMRDGTVLRADVYMPKGKGPFPALLERTPYSKDNSPECQVGSPPFFASQGYAVVIQDVRGRFASEGRFIPFHDDGWGENRDGYDTVEWIAAQPWCDGNVGTIGGSYAGVTQYRMAPTRPPHLRAMYVRESSADYWAEWVYHGGAFELGFMVEWTVRWTHNNLARLARSPEELAQRKGVLAKALEELPTLAPGAAARPEPARRGPRRLVQRIPGASGGRPVLVALEHRPPARRDRDAHRPHGRVVRHLPRRDDQELRRHPREGAHPGGAGRPAPRHRAVDPRALEHGEERAGRGGLRPGGDPGLQRDPGALVRSLASRHAECRARRAARPAVRHGREPLAHRRRLPVARGARDARGTSARAAA